MSQEPPQSQPQPQPQQANPASPPQRKPNRKDVDLTLMAHNHHRHIHQAEPLKWSSDCHLTAQQWAERLAQEASQRRPDGTLLGLRHGGLGKGMGQNLWWGADDSATPIDAIQAWMKTAALYDPEQVEQSKGSPAASATNFTQVVWKKTRKVGLGIVRIPRPSDIPAQEPGVEIDEAHKYKYGTFVVANYLPHGNTKGQYQANVSIPSQNTNNNRSPPRTVRFKDNGAEKTTSAATDKDKDTNNTPNTVDTEDVYPPEQSILRILPDPTDDILSHTWATNGNTGVGHTPSIIASTGTYPPHSVANSTNAALVSRNPLHVSRPAHCASPRRGGHGSGVSVADWERLFSDSVAKELWSGSNNNTSNYNGTTQSPPPLSPRSLLPNPTNQRSGSSFSYKPAFHPQISFTRPNSQSFARS